MLFKTCFSIHAISTATAYCCSSPVNCLPAGIWCHLKKQPRQQQPVACWAMNTGCPLIGVCLPSLGITAGARRLATKSSACLRMVAKPFSAIYSLSLFERWNRLRNVDLESLSNKSVKSYSLSGEVSLSMFSEEIESFWWSSISSGNKLFYIFGLVSFWIFFHFYESPIYMNLLYI